MAVSFAPAPNPARAELPSTQALDTTWVGGAGTRAVAANPRGARVDLHDGSRTGRYRIVGVLGRGAMGVVYEAYDERLDRRVALKVPLLEHGGTSTRAATLRRGRSAAQTRARLIKEARGLAQLSHPNVVQVFSVEHFRTVPGLVDGACAIAMEIVEGTPLDVWLDEPRGWREVLGVYLEAGRGLAAAHDAGLVHRDFKPSNVVLGSDDRTRVMDFGLVAEVDDDDEPTTVPLSADCDTTLTHTGCAVGTPAYMAPEQHLGESAAAASDQFSFCVALFEALFGMRPFAGGSLDALLENKRHGRTRQLPRDHGVPPGIVAAVLRGLSARASLRFASMNDLLAALAPQRVRRRATARRGVAGLALLAAAVLAAISIPNAPADVGKADAPTLARR